MTARGYARWIAAHARMTIAMSVLLVMFAGAGVSKLVYIADYEVYFPDNNARLEAYREIESTYTKFDNVLFAVVARHGTVFEPSVLDAVAWLTEAAWQLPHTQRVDSITNFQHTHAVGDDVVISDLFDNPPSMSQVEITNRARVALEEPRLRSLLHPNGDATGVLVSVRLPGEGSSQAIQHIAGSARELAEQFRAAYPQFDLHLTGTVIINQAYLEAVLGDATTLVPLMYLLVLVFIGVLFRSTMVALSVALCVLGAVVTAFGITGAIHIPLTNAASNVPTMIMVLAVASAVHLCMSFAVHLAELGDRRIAVVNALDDNARPIFLTSVTTCIGFLCLNLGDLPPYADMGTMVALGVAASFVLTLTLLPALLVVLPIKRVHTVGADWARRIGAFVVNRRRSILLIGLGLSVLFASLVPRNEFNDSFLTYLDENDPARVDTERVIDRLAGIYTFIYTLPSAGPGQVDDPAYLRAVDHFSTWLEEQPQVSWVSSIAPTIKRINQVMHGDDPRYYSVPDEVAEAAQYRLLYELSLPYGLGLTDQIDIARSQTRLTLGIGDLTNKELRGLDAQIHAWLSEQIPQFASPAVGPTVMFSYIWAWAAQGMVLSLLVAAFAIAVLIALALRSAKLGAISIATNLIPPLVAFGFWALIDGWVDMGAAYVATITLGIIVDDTIHFLSRYQRGRSEGMSAEGAVDSAFTRVGPALILTTVVIALGFSVLGFSQFDVNKTIGLLATVTVIIALAFDLLVLPALLLVIEKVRWAEGHREVVRA